MLEETEAEFVENFLIVWDSKKGSDLFGLGF